MGNTLFPQPSEPLPPPQPAPDYLATIQAPIPTPEPDQAVPSTTTAIYQTDRQRLTDWMVSSAWMSAAAAFSRASPERLLSLTAVSQERNPCYQQLAGGVHLLATGGKLLAPTGDITQQAIDCLDRAAGRNPQADNYLAQSLPERAQLLAELLRHHSIAGNPYTQQAASAPSPENIGQWRTVWPHQQHCRDDIARRAARVAALPTADETVAGIREQFDQIADCLSRPTEAAE